MNKKYTVLLFASLIAGWFIFQGASGGVALVQNADRTNAPGSSFPCGGCHSGGNFSASLAFDIRDTSTYTQVTSMNAGQTYSIRWWIKHQGASRFGFQGTVRTSGNADIGTWSNPASNTAIRTVSGHTVVEHNSASVVDSFVVLYTAPTNEDSIFFFGSGNACNGDGGTSGDQYATLANQNLVLVNLPVGVEEVSQEDFKVFPTPANDRIFVKGSYNAPYQIYDLSGKLWLQGSVTSAPIDVTMLPVGAYIISTQGETAQAEKVIISR